MSPQELDAIRADLARADSRRAYEGICRLIQSPDQAVAFLSDHWRSIDAVDADRIDCLITDFDSEQLDVREKATTELKQLLKLV